MFNAIATTKTLEQFTTTAQALVDEAKLNLRENMLHLTAVDPANVAMVDQTLGASAFESYEADGGVIALNLETLGDVLKMGDSDSLVHLELDEQTRKLHIEVDGLSYTQSLIDPDSVRQEPDIPELETEGTATVFADDLDDMVTAADLVSDHIGFGFDCDAGELYAEAEGDTDDVRFTLDGEEDLVDGEFAADAHSLFSLDFMKDLKKPIESDTEVEIELGQELPVKLHYEYAEGHGVVTNMLAPRVKND